MDNGHFNLLKSLVPCSSIYVRLVIVDVFSMQVKVKAIVLMYILTHTQTDNVCVVEKVNSYPLASC